MAFHSSGVYLFRLDGPTKVSRLVTVKMKERNMQDWDPILIVMGVVGALAFLGSFWVKRQTEELKRALRARREVPMKTRVAQRRVDRHLV